MMIDDGDGDGDGDTIALDRNDVLMSAQEDMVLEVVGYLIDSHGVRHLIYVGDNIIGRDVRKNAVVLLDSSISRICHAVVSVRRVSTGIAYTIEDCNSVNGSFLNGSRLSSGVAYSLSTCPSSNDIRLQFGLVKCCFVACDITEDTCIASLPSTQAIDIVDDKRMRLGSSSSIGVIDDTLAMDIEDDNVTIESDMSHREVSREITGTNANTTDKERHDGDSRDSPVAAAPDTVLCPSLSVSSALPAGIFGNNSDDDFGNLSDEVEDIDDNWHSLVEGRSERDDVNESYEKTIEGTTITTKEREDVTDSGDEENELAEVIKLGNTAVEEAGKSDITAQVQRESCTNAKNTIDNNTTAELEKEEKHDSQYVNGITGERLNDDAERENLGTEMSSLLVDARYSDETNVNTRSISDDDKESLSTPVATSRESSNMSDKIIVEKVNVNSAHEGNIVGEDMTKGVRREENSTIQNDDKQFLSDSCTDVNNDATEYKMMEIAEKEKNDDIIMEEQLKDTSVSNDEKVVLSTSVASCHELQNTNNIITYDNEENNYHCDDVTFISSSQTIERPLKRSQDNDDVDETLLKKPRGLPARKSMKNILKRKKEIRNCEEANIANLRENYNIDSCLTNSKATSIEVRRRSSRKCASKNHQSTDLSRENYATSASLSSSSSQEMPAEILSESTEPEKAIMFSGFVDDSLSEWVESRKESSLKSDIANISNGVVTHVVVDRLDCRTAKVLLAKLCDVPVVTRDWLEQSRSSGHFVNPLPFVVDLGAKSRPLEGLNIYLMFSNKAIQNNAVDLKAVVVTAGGSLLEYAPKIFAKNIRIVFLSKDSVVTTAIIKRCAKLVDLGFNIYSSSFIRESVLRDSIYDDATLISAN